MASPLRAALFTNYSEPEPVARQDVALAESTRERSMAREAEKSGRESGKQKTEDTNSTGSKGAASAGSDKGEGEEGGSRSTARAEGKGGGSRIAEFQSQRHRELEGVLARRSEGGADARAIVREFAALWLPNHRVEVEILVPALQDAGADEDKMAAARIRADIVNLLLADLIETEAAEFAEAKLEALADAFAALALASSRERESFFDIESEGLAALGPQMAARYERAKGSFQNIDESIGEAMDLLAPRSLSVSSGRRRRVREKDMARYSSMPDRDEQGRFLPEDDRGRSSSRSSRGRYEEDEGNGYRGRRSMSRGRDDDERYYSGRGDDRGHGGWFGDSEGHSEASRRGWDRSDHGDSGWYGDREGHSEASRRGWQRSDHGESGWFRDPEGHSEASRRGWRSGHHGESGWFGDPEGHSEAARRGWDEGGHRSQRRDDDEGYRSRSRYEDDDRRSGYESRSGGRYEDDDRRGYESRRRSEDDDERGSRGRSSSRGHGGWSGDPEGHSEASRKGWEHRR